MNNQIRNDFETWVSVNGHSIDRVLPGEYRSAETELAWTVWEARAIDKVALETARAKIIQLREQNTLLDSACASQDAEIEWLRDALGFYADTNRYHGPNQRVIRDYDPFTPEGAKYVQDVTRDRGNIARAALDTTT